MKSSTMAVHRSGILGCCPHVIATEKAPRQKTRQQRGWGSALPKSASKVGGLIRQGFPLPVVLTTLCQHFDATVHGCSSSVLLLDRAGTRVRSSAGSGLPASYMKQLEGKRVRWVETPFGATINEKTPVIVFTPRFRYPTRGGGPRRGAWLQIVQGFADIIGNWGTARNLCHLSAREQDRLSPFSIRTHRAVHDPCERRH